VVPILLAASESLVADAADSTAAEPELCDDNNDEDAPDDAVDVSYEIDPMTQPTTPPLLWSIPWVTKSDESLLS